MPNKFMIVGCQRSGTTLMRLILESHSNVNCIDEGKSYDILSDNEKINKCILDSKNKKWIGFKVPAFTPHLDKNEFSASGHIYRNLYKNEPLLFMVRDVRDVICSFKRWRERDGSSLYQWAEDIYRGIWRIAPKYRELFSSDIEKLKHSKYFDLLVAAFYWKTMNVYYFEYSKLNFPVYRIKYEELVENPKKIISGVIKYLQLNWEDNLLQHHLLPHAETDENGITVAYNNVRMPISSFSVGNYQSDLSNDQINEIFSITSDMMRSFDYKI